jgi:hypothetical protein
MTLKSKLEKSKKIRIVPPEEARKLGTLVWFLGKRRERPAKTDRRRSDGRDVQT